jgi:acetyl esterase
VDEISLPLADRLSRPLVRALARLPAPVAERLAGGPVRNDRGDVLDPHSSLLVKLQKLTRRPGYEVLGPAAARRENLISTHLVDSDPPAGVARRVRRVPTPHGDLRAFVYAPTIPRAAAPAPVLVYLHGGGFCVGSLEGYDAVCRTIAARARCLVVSVDYRLAPESPLPASSDDALHAYLWARREAATLTGEGGPAGDPGRVAVGGDSAGGNLAAVTALRARDEGHPPPHAQWLVYPATDATRALPSHRRFARGYLLESTTIDWFMEHWLAGADPAGPLASPLRAARHDHLPPAHVVVAGFDPLRDEGLAYADALRAAGVPVILQDEPALLHGFLSTTGASPAARAARDAAIDGLARLLERRPSEEARAGVARHVGGT